MALSHSRGGAQITRGGTGGSTGGSTAVLFLGNCLPGEEHKRTQRAVVREIGPKQRAASPLLCGLHLI